MSMTADELEKELKEFNGLFGKLKGEIGKAIVGYDELLTDTLVAVFAQGHSLLEGVPGLGENVFGEGDLAGVGVGIG